MSSEWAGKYIIVRMWRGEDWLLKLHNVHTQRADGTHYYHTPLPNDKQELKAFLLQVAEREGIDLVSV